MHHRWPPMLLGENQKDCSTVSLLQPKTKPLVCYRFLCTRLLTRTGRQENLSTTSGCCGTGDLCGTSSAEEGNKPAACSQYQLFFLPIKLAAHSHRQQKLFEKGEKVGWNRWAKNGEPQQGKNSEFGTKNLQGAGRNLIGTVGDVTCTGTFRTCKNRKKVHLISSFPAVNLAKI